MSERVARRLLAAARREKEQLPRHLLVAAALREVLSSEPIVVGGTAEEFWTRAEYHPTDLDVCVPIDPGDRERLRALGFSREGRHWIHDLVPTVAVEIPDSRIDGDPARSHLERIDEGAARIIGLDDLYLDRLRQATANPVERSTEFMSALAVMAARYEELDRRYIDDVLNRIERGERMIGTEMRRIDRLLARRVRRRLAEPPGSRPRG